MQTLEFCLVAGRATFNPEVMRSNFFLCAQITLSTVKEDVIRKPAVLDPKIDGVFGRIYLPVKKENIKEADTYI